MPTTTTSPREASPLPSYSDSLPDPPVKAPPWIQNMTALREVFVFSEGIKGVQMFRNRQSSLLEVAPVWTHSEPKLRASMVLFPVYAVGYSHRTGGSAYGIPKNLNEVWSRNLGEH